jgi:methylated-DNA-protein-cysteine methyltransferase-like protein
MREQDEPISTSPTSRGGGPPTVGRDRTWVGKSAMPPADDITEPSRGHLQILSVIQRIPEGRVCTYGRIAEAAGLPRRARLVGRILHDSPLADDVPWHRVINASGRISDRPGGATEQLARLAAEGVEVTACGRVDLGTYLWQP